MKSLSPKAEYIQQCGRHRRSIIKIRQGNCLRNLVEKPMQSKRPTERSEQKVQGHAPGQGQGVKPIAGSRDRVPCGYRAKPCRSMRQSLIRRKPTKRCRQKKKKYKFSSSTKQTSKHKPAPLYYPPAQSKIRKERSDFAVR